MARYGKKLIKENCTMKKQKTKWYEVEVMGTTYRTYDIKAESKEKSSSSEESLSSVKSNNSRLSITKPRGERLRVVKAVQKSRSIKPERDMSYHTGRPVMVSGRGQGTGLFAQPQTRRPATDNGFSTTKRSSNGEDGVADELRRELVALKVEHDARAQMVELLMQKIAVLEKDVESGKLNKPTYLLARNCSNSG